MAFFTIPRLCSYHQSRSICISNWLNSFAINMLSLCEGLTAAGNNWLRMECQPWTMLPTPVVMVDYLDDVIPSTLTSRNVRHNEMGGELDITKNWCIRCKKYNLTFIWKWFVNTHMLTRPMITSRLRENPISIICFLSVPHLHGALHDSDGMYVVYLVKRLNRSSLYHTLMNISLHHFTINCPNLTSFVGEMHDTPKSGIYLYTCDE